MKSAFMSRAVADTVQAIKKPLLTLNIDLDVMEVPRVKKDGSEFYEVDFEVHMTLQSARLNFVLDRNNKKYDPKDVTFT